MALFTVDVQLTKACMTPVQLQSALCETFIDYLSSPASALHTVQVMSMKVDMGGETCSPAEGRRSLRTLRCTVTAHDAIVPVPHFPMVSSRHRCPPSVHTWNPTGLGVCVGLRALPTWHPTSTNHDIWQLGHRKTHECRSRET